MATLDGLGNVLVASDFTRHAHDAAARAAWLPIAPGSSITVVHVLPPRLGGAIEARLRATADALLSGAVATLAAEAERAGQRGVDVFTAIELGRPADVIAQRARDERAELVVVGRGEARGLGERLLGSTAERIARACDTSVLVVGARPEAPYRRPLVAVDLSEQARPTLQAALRLCDPRAERIEVVHAVDAPYLTMLQDSMGPEDLRQYLDELDEAARQRLAEVVAGAGGAVVQTRVRRGPPRRTLVEEAKTTHADLLVVGRRGHSTAGRLLMGSTAEALLRDAPCDVLVAR